MNLLLFLYYSLHIIPQDLNFGGEDQSFRRNPIFFYTFDFTFNGELKGKERMALQLLTS